MSTVRSHIWSTGLDESAKISETAFIATSLEASDIRFLERTAADSV